MGVIVDMVTMRWGLRPSWRPTWNHKKTMIIIKISMRIVISHTIRTDKNLMRPIIWNVRNTTSKKKPIKIKIIINTIIIMDRIKTNNTIITKERTVKTKTKTKMVNTTIIMAIIITMANVVNANDNYKIIITTTTRMSIFIWDRDVPMMGN